jgi:hypothetical protein
MVAMKTLMALLIMLIGLRILPPPFAFLASILLAINWGDPLIGPVNALYAGHVNHFITLSAVLAMMLYLHSGRKRWLFCTSACIGLSALFKLHMAGVDFIGFALLLSFKEQGSGSSIPDSDFPDAQAGLGAIRLLRVMKILAIAGVAAFYFGYLTGPNLSVASFFMFDLPLCLLLGYILISDLRILPEMRPETAAMHRQRLLLLCKELAILASFPLACIIFVVLLYTTLGGLPDLLHDIFVLPTYIKYYHPMAGQRAIAGLIAGIVFAVLMSAQIGLRVADRGKTARFFFAAIVTAAPVLLSIAALQADLSYRRWHMLATHIVLPTALIVGVFLFLWRISGRRPAAERSKESLNLALVFIFASQSSLLISLRSDETHIVTYSTIIFVVVAFLLMESIRAWKRMLPERAIFPAAVTLFIFLAALSTPYLWSMKIFHFPAFTEGTSERGQADGARSYPMLIPDAPRARGLRLPVWGSLSPPLHHPMFFGMNETVNFIRDNTSPDERIFLTCGDQMIYFLSERESVLQKENYFAYLSNTNLIDSANTGIVSDGDILERLASANPRFIVETPGFADTVYFGLTWPKTQMFIKNSYEVDTIFGEYQILRRRGSLSQPRRER